MHIKKDVPSMDTILWRQWCASLNIKVHFTHFDWYSTDEFFAIWNTREVIRIALMAAQQMKETE